MNDEKDNKPRQPIEEDDTLRLINQLQSCEDSSTTINFDDLTAAEGLTTSGSVDVREIRQAAYGKLLQALPIPILFIDRSYSVCYVSRAIAKFTAKYEEIKGVFFPELFPDPDRPKMDPAPDPGLSELDEAFQRRPP